ncbi:MAG: undecaprenyl-diphosphate phosphatase [Candidatus Omnitrophota bacterium]
MTITQAIILGIVQGITEFFPISSSGHLVALQGIFGLKESKIAFDIFLHFGTLVAVLAFFRKEILALFGKERKLLLFLVIASIPTFIIAIVFKDMAERLFAAPKVVGYMLLVTGAWLIASVLFSKKIETRKELTAADSILIGIAQGIAIIPGISRSGATIATGFLAGLDKELCVRFSFLLSIPAVLGAIVFKARKIAGALTGQDPLTFIAGGLAAMCVGLIAIKLLLKMARSDKFYMFGVYCIIVGLIVIVRF